MDRDEIRKLLGGYATGTLTPEEQETLFSAALEDQELFDALANDQALRDLMRDPASKVQMLAALEPKPPRWGWWRPMAAAFAVASVAALVILVIRPVRHETRLADMAIARQPQESSISAQPATAPGASQPTVEVKQRPQKDAPSPRQMAADTVREQRKEEALSKIAPAVPTPAEAAAEAKKDLAVVSGARADAAPAGVAGAPPAPPPPAAVAAPKPAAAANEATAAGVQGNVQAAQNTSNAQNTQMPFVQQNAEVQQNARQLNDAIVRARNASLPRAEVKEEARDKKSVENTTFGTTGAVAQRAAARQPSGPAVKYSVLRKTAEGEFQEAQPDSLRADDRIRIRFQPLQNGYLYVADTTGRIRLASAFVQQGNDFTTPDLPARTSEVLVVLSQQAQSSLDSAAFGSDGRAVRVDRVSRESDTYFGSKAAPGIVRFIITLKYK